MIPQVNQGRHFCPQICRFFLPSAASAFAIASSSQERRDLLPGLMIRQDRRRVQISLGKASLQSKVLLYTKLSNCVTISPIDSEVEEILLDYCVISFLYFLVGLNYVSGTLEARNLVRTKRRSPRATAWMLVRVIWELLANTREQNFGC